MLKKMLPPQTAVCTNKSAYDFQSYGIQKAIKNHSPKLPMGLFNLLGIIIIK